MSQVKGKKVSKNVSISDEVKNKEVSKVRKRKVNLEKKVSKEDISENNSSKKRKLKKVKGSKIRYYRLYEKNYDGDKDINEIDLNDSVASDDNFSIGIIIFILMVCFVLGISLGYLLYRLAISSSAMIVFSSIIY